MIVCKACGNHNADTETFCDSCQTFLEWDGVRIDDTPAFVEGPEAVEARPGLIERVKTAVGLDGQNGAERAPEGDVEPATGLLVTPLAASSAPAAGAGAGAVPGAKGSTASTTLAGTSAAHGSVVDDPASYARDEQARRALAMAKPVAEPAPPTKTTSTNVGPRTPTSPALVDIRTAQPESRPPGEQRTPKAPKLTVPTDANPGDVICGKCGAANIAQRNFCRRCAAELVEPVVVKVSWWRRLFRRKRKREDANIAVSSRSAGGSGASAIGGGAAGTAGAASANAGRGASGVSGRVKESGRAARRRARMTVRAGKSVFGRITRVAAVLGVMGVAGASFGPWSNSLHVRANRIVQDVRQRIHKTVTPTFVAVTPIGATATSSAAAHDPSLLIDNADTTYWAVGRIAAGTLASITITFKDPVDLSRVGFRNGSSDDTTVAQPRRPAKVRLIFGDGREKAITLKDILTFQQFSVSANDVTKVQVIIDSVHGPASGHASAITEIEFFTKK